MSGRMQAIAEQLKTKRATGSSGGGMIQAEVNGLGELLRVTIDPLLMERQDREMIEDLIPAAVNQAQQRAKEMHADAMKSLTEGMDLPGLGGLGEMLAKLSGGEGSDGRDQ